MRFTSLRIITHDVARLAGFYEFLTGASARWASPDFAEIATPSLTLAIGSIRTVAVFGPGLTIAPHNSGRVLIEFLVDDVDAEYDRLQTAAGRPEFVSEPKDMPWGNRSLLVRDPDGTLVNLFTPRTEQAKAKYA
ncbi:VOC family protein [Hamadaea tsunoensis]|uniref:VOC family protein n=1 Tax=Hamadaea tsunoensis TaxID=53368 RepID=UPI0004106D27|nr:VOC family protein [Hamadaea tsunoensis]